MSELPVAKWVVATFTRAAAPIMGDKLAIEFDRNGEVLTVRLNGQKLPLTPFLGGS